MTIGQTIRALRKKAGLTQNQLGALCGITGGAVSSYENGVTTPKRRTAEKLAAALGVSLGRLQGEPPAGPPQRPAPVVGVGYSFAAWISFIACWVWPLYSLPLMSPQVASNWVGVG